MKTKQTELTKKNQERGKLYRQLFILKIELKTLNELEDDRSAELAHVIQSIDHFMNVLIEQSGMR